VIFAKHVQKPYKSLFPFVTICSLKKEKKKKIKQQQQQQNICNTKKRLKQIIK
jgi:hypothetical protein